MARSCVPVLAGALLLLALTPAHAADQATRFETEVTDQGIWVREADQPVFFYQRATKSLEGGWPRANYLHPVYDLDGNELTEDFPADHRHHRGIFWAWHQALLGEQHVGDPWVCQDALWDVRDVKIEQDAATVKLHTHVVWQSPLAKDDQGKLLDLVAERGTIRVHAAENDQRKIDFEISLKALQPEFRLGGSDDRKGYGGFCVRVKLPDGTKFNSREGELTPQTTGIEAGPWLDIEAPYYANGKRSGVSVFSHRDNPSYPEPWILRRARSMQNPAWPGRDPVKLSTKKPTVLRYRVVLHRQAVPQSTVQQWYDEYIKK